MGALKDRRAVAGQGVLGGASTAGEFVSKWSRQSSAHKLGERQGSHQHFIELCDLLGVPRPSDPDNYCFERSFPGPTGTFRYADVWKRGCFAWEYKRPGKSLVDALEQLMRYTLPLENPPLLVVSDRDSYEIHTHFTGYPSRRIAFKAQELLDPAVRARMRAAFLDPYSFRPEQDSRQVTERAAIAFAAIADVLRKPGTPGRQVAHFLTQCVFCYFAEDIGLLQNNVFKRIAAKRSEPERLRADLTRLFTTMRKGGAFGADDIPWFNGGLFNVIEVPPLPKAAVNTLADAAGLDWSAIDPGIFGTLFQRGLDPRKRVQLGAFYTNPALIAKLVDPVVKQPLLREWDHRLREINGLLSKRDVLNVQASHMTAKTLAQRTKAARVKTTANRAARTAQDIFNEFLEMLRNFRVLDPACGSGNFLYLALKALKDVEKQAHVDAETLGLRAQFQVTGVQNVLGIELDEYAAELARMTVWIGELQWRKQNGYGWKLNPILENLDHIECRDALLQEAPRLAEAQWPRADVVVGNPPFLGDKKMRAALGREYVDRLRGVFARRVPGGADLVTYWFAKSLEAVKAGELKRAGLVATNSIRGGRSREVLDRIAGQSRIFEAWSDEPWVNEGAAVRVSLIAFGDSDIQPKLNGRVVPRIFSDLCAGSSEVAEAADLTRARTLLENRSTAFNGIQKTGPFDVPGHVARDWLRQPKNVNGEPNARVLAPYRNGLDVVRRPRDMWIVDFGWTMSEKDASSFELPFRYVREVVKPVRDSNTLDALRRDWWRVWRPRPDMRERIDALPRYIVTPEVSKHRVFAWVPSPVLPDKNLVVFARADDATFGILHSRFHVVWSLRQGTSLEDRPRYTPSSCFETFPFPAGLTPADTNCDTLLIDGVLIPSCIPAARKAATVLIAERAKRLDELRQTWLNPPEWCRLVPEVVKGRTRSGRLFPDVLCPRPPFEKNLNQRTLTNLYNRQPDWLRLAHEELDLAVAAAYGWADYTAAMPDEELLRRLLDLNLQRQAVQEHLPI